jgi:hypothetical protein
VIFSKLVSKIGRIQNAICSSSSSFVRKKKEEEGIFVLRIQYIVGSGGVGHRYMVGNCVFPRESGYKV